MGANKLHIEAKVRTDPVSMVSPADFVCREGKDVDPRVVLDLPTLSLYCLDHERCRAIFVETPPDVDLFAAPFYYQQQYDTAQSLVAVSYETLHELAGDIRLDPSRIVLVYSVSRCGSTLVSLALNEGDGVASFSEPDVFTQLLSLRGAGAVEDTELSALIRSCILVMCASAARANGASTWIFKFRSMVIELGGLLREQFPEARVVFLYRHAEEWARSVARAFNILDPERMQQMPERQAAFARLIPLVDQYAEKRPTTLSIMELLACRWIAAVDRCLQLQRQGVNIFALRYEDLKASRRQALAALFDFSGITVSDVAALNRVLAHDSQAGTMVSQSRAQRSSSELNDEHIAELRRRISEIAPGMTPDVIVPGSFAP